MSAVAGAAHAGGRWGPLRRAAARVAPRRGRLALSVALGAGAILAAVALLAVAGVLISRAALRPSTILSLTTLTVSIRALAISRALLRYFERLVSHDLALRMLADLRVRFFERLAPLVPEGLRGLRGGDVLSRFVADVDSLQDLYLRALGPPLIAAVVIVVVGVFLLFVLPPAAVVMVVALLLAAIVVPALAGAATAASNRHQAPARALLATELVDVVQGAPELAVYGREADWAARVAAADGQLLAIQRRDARVAGLSTGLGVLIAGAALVAVAALGVQATSSGALDGILLAAVVFIAIGSFEAVIPLPDAAQRLNACASAAARIEEVTEAPVVVADPPRPLPLPPGGSLVACEVTVRFADRETPALDQVSVRVAPGARVAIVGRSGAGKTTLARLLVRFRDPEAGAVEVGGLDVRAARQSDVRRSVRLAGQDAHLFTTTIRQNVRLANPQAGDAAILSALGRAGLSDWIAGLPDGLDTAVGEDGAEVSGGQRRRIALARAFVSDARFLVLDEPTAHVDPTGARELLRALGEDRDDQRGVLVISHTVAGLERFDEILVLDGGRVVERGGHAELLARGGAFAALAAVA
ncbi:MAG TPA: thiol reductant ABC exporter subunit CydC [Solirubrobacteraceae bacterium]|nr:thiol reductant ABC exporter subunit CydC [Solirubrobacteraceae bacterium]